MTTVRTAEEVRGPTPKEDLSPALRAKLAEMDELLELGHGVHTVLLKQATPAKHWNGCSTTL